MMRTMIWNHKTLIMAIILTAVILGGCAKKIVDSDRGCEVFVSINAKSLAPAAIGTIDSFLLFVEGPDFGSIEEPMVRENGFIIARVEVPSGRDRRFVARALDADGIALYRGEAVADVVPRTTVTLNIDLFPVVPMINVTPHYQNARMNDTVFVNVSVYNIPDLSSLTFTFSASPGPYDFGPIVKNPELGDSVLVTPRSSDNLASVIVDVAHTDESSRFVDERGYARMLTFSLFTYNDWEYDTATVILLAQPTLIYLGTGRSFPPESVYTDNAVIELHGQPDTLQPPTWERTFGGAGDDAGYSVCLAPDGGGYIIAGQSDSLASGNHDIYLMRVDTLGNLEWGHIFGGALAEKCFSVKPSPLGGYIIAGASQSFGAGDWDVFLVKTDNFGNLQWQFPFGSDAWDEGRDVIATADGGCLVVGRTEAFGASNVYVIKTNAAGDSLWSGIYGGEGWDEGWSVARATDGGYVITGSTQSLGVGEDVYLLKVDSTGSFLWERNFGGNLWDLGRNIQPTFDGGFIIIGLSQSFGAGQEDIYLIKTDALGRSPWAKTFGGAGSEKGYSVYQTADGGYILAGSRQPLGSADIDVYLYRVTNNGNPVWDQIYGGLLEDVGHSVRPTDDGGYVVAGYTLPLIDAARDLYVIKTDADGIVYKTVISGL